MAKQVYTDARLFLAGADVSGSTNKIDLQIEAEAKETTNFRSAGNKEFIAGLRSASLSGEGQWEAGAGYVDDAAWAQRGAVPGPWSLCPNDATDGALCYFTSALSTNYVLLGAVGDVAPFKVDATGSSAVVRGIVGNAPGTARTTTGTGTSRQLGAVAEGQRLYANLHVLSASGTTPSITFRVESDDSTGFASATTQITFAAATAGETFESKSVAGPITDDWFRVAWAVSGTTPSFLALVTIGIA